MLCGLIIEQDLIPFDVFICPDTFKVKSVVGWQHASITPMALAAGYPRMFANPKSGPPGPLVPPAYPEEDDYDTMDSEEKAVADELTSPYNLFYFYRVFNGGSKLHHAALRDPLFLQRQRLVDLASNKWFGNAIPLRGALMRIFRLWDSGPGKHAALECPIDFSEEEMRDHEEIESTWEDLDAQVNLWHYVLGLDASEGWLPTEEYDAAVKANECLKAEVSDGASPDQLDKIKQSWPFQDHEELF